MSMISNPEELESQEQNSRPREVKNLNNTWLKESLYKGTFLFILLLFFIGSAYGQAANQVSSPQETGTVVVTGRLTNEKEKPLAGQIIKFAAIIPDCDCEQPRCKFITCVECCSRGTGQGVIDSEGKYKVLIKLPPGIKYRFARIVGGSFLIFESKAVMIKPGKTEKVKNNPFVDFLTHSQ